MGYPAEVISALEMENGVTDEVGTYAWTNESAVAFSGDIKKYGSYSAAFDNADTDEIIVSDSAITGIKTIEFQLYWNDDGDSNTFIFGGSGSGIVSMQLENGYLRLWTGSQWSGTVSISELGWNHVAVTFDDSNAKIYLDGVEKVSVACGLPGNQIWGWGNHAANKTLTIDANLDRCILRNDTTDGSETVPTEGYFNPLNKDNFATSKQNKIIR